jgi:type II secretory pathway pseudopilin PulG
VSGRKLAYALAAIALLVFVLPPLAARQVHARRIGRARQDVQRIATALMSEHYAALKDAMASAGGKPVVLTGPGVPPRFAPGVGWPDAMMLPWSAMSNDTTDPWGNQYLVAIAAGPGASVAVLSAGPNGTVDTPFASAGVSRGDDVSR